MALEFHRTIIDRLPDPVLLLNEQGEVVGFNPAARVLIESEPELMTTLAPFVQAAAARVDIQPMRLNPDVPLILDGTRYAPWLMPTREEMALILLPDDAERGVRHQPIGSQPDVAFSSLLNAEMRQELHRVIDKLGAIGSGATGLRQEAQRMQQLLTTVDVMCTMLQHPQSVHGERLTLHELVLQALAQRRLSSSCLTQSGFTRTPGTRHFYGHTPWLLWTLDTLLAHMPLSMETGGRQLTLHLRHGDSSLVLSGGLRSPASPSSPLEASSAYNAFASMDFVDGKQRNELDASTRLALASRIVEYHGGYLNLDTDPSDATHPLRGFQLSMPLGRTPSTVLTATPGRWVPLGQAEMLARDLARLLPRRSANPPPALSDTERDMFVHLHAPTQN